MYNKFIMIGLSFCQFGVKQHRKLYGILLSLSIFICSGLVQAQMIPGDVRGNSTLILFNDELREYGLKNQFDLFYNTANDKARVTAFSSDPTDPVKARLEISGQAANGITAFLANLDRSSKTAVTAAIGYCYKTNREENPNPFVSNQSFMVEFGYNRGAYTLLEKTAGVSSNGTGTPTQMAPSGNENSTPMQAQNVMGTNEETITQIQTGPSMTLYYNVLIKESLLTGFSVGYARQNNYTTLKEGQVADISHLGGTGREKQLIQNRMVTRLGDYKEFDALSARADLLYIPAFGKSESGETVDDPKLALNLFFRYTYRDGGGNLYEPGFGVFKLTKGTPAANAHNSKKCCDKVNANEGAAANTSAIECQHNNSAPIVPEEKKVIAPWKIVYGVVGQWNAEVEEFQFGVVGGLNF